jgi:hypothetical protein
VPPARAETKVMYMFEHMTRTERFELAKAKMERVLDHFLYVLELHANNEFAVFTSTLSGQIPKSFAANAFNVFQRSMYQFEIVRLCALWDSTDPEKENIPTVVELIDDERIIQELAQLARANWVNIQPTDLMNPSPDPVLAAMLRESNARFGDEQAARAEIDLKETIAKTEAILCSPRLASVMNMRDKHLAHSLTETRREKKVAIPPMRYGDETALLNDSIPIIERLFCWVNGKSFSTAYSQKIDHDNAQALWSGCKFNVLH